MTEPNTVGSDRGHPAVADNIIAMLDDELSFRGRLLTMLLLLSSLTVTGITASLWMSERGLPLRTHLGFGLVVCGGLCWAGYAVWVLARRRVLYSAFRLTLSRLAVVFCSTFLAASVALAILVPAKAGIGIAAAIFAGPMVAVAVLGLLRARRRHRALERRRRDLELELGHTAR